MNAPTAPQTPLQELAKAVGVPFERARCMPKSAYTSPEFLALEREKVFARDWVCAGRASSLAKPGDYLTLEVAGEPVIVLRDQDNALRALSNVCRHRMSTLLEGRGNTRSIVCPYHAWTYGLDGQLRGAPAMARNTTFQRDEIALPALRCVDWQGWILVTRHQTAPEPSVQLAGLDALIGDYGMADYVEAFQEEFLWDTNWKVLAENFMESYHLPVCHAGTIGHTVDLNEMVCPEGEPAFNYHWILKNDAFDLTLAHPTNRILTGDLRRTTWLITIYPALMITLTPGYFWYLSLTPMAPGQVKVLYGGGLSPDWAADPEAPAHFERLRRILGDVNQEDKICTERVWRGLCASLSEPGPLSHLERPNYDFARYLLNRMQA